MFATATMRCALAGFVCCALLAGLVDAASVDAPKQSIDIPAGDLVASLDRLAQLSGIEFVYDADHLKDIQSHGVTGYLTPKEAVKKLLEGTNLTLTEHASGALLIAPPQDNSERAFNSVSAAVGNSGDLAPSAQSNLTLAGRIPNSPAEADQITRSHSILDEIVITGTHIAGAAPVGSALIVYTRTEIEQSGSATLEQFARQMPQNFSGADTLATRNTNANLGNFQQGAANNIFAGAGFNLNGLGPGSTLTLLNGHRLVPGGFDGSLVDISQIPLSAIDHLEVLDDGASAIYGSDAVAGVVNIITRMDFGGAETGLRYGAATQGGAQEYTATQLLGHAWATGNLLLNYEYDDAGGLDAAQRSWIDRQAGPLSLMPESRRNSVFVSGSQSIGSGTSLSVNGLYSDREFKTNGLIAVPDGIAGESTRGHAKGSAAILSLDHDFTYAWHATVTGNYSNMQQQANTGTYALPAYGLNGPANEQLLANSGIGGIDVLGSGPLVSLPGGSVQASLGASFRTEQFKSFESAESPLTPISRQRQVTSAYGELLIPYFGDSSAPLWVRRLEFSAAYRYDHYSDFGSSSNPKFGVSWEPLTGLRLRGTYGRSFQAPSISQLESPITSSTTQFPDNGAPSGSSDVLEINGGNPELRPETSRSITAGFDYKPVNVRGLDVSATYFNVLFQDRIQSQSITSQELFSQPLLIPYLVLNPTLAVVQSYFKSPGFQGDNAGLGPGGVSAIFDNQLVNIASTVESGLNFSAQYGVTTAYGHLNFWLSGTRLLSDRIRTASYVPAFDIDNNIGEPTSWKARGGIGWAQDGFIANFTINYANAYQNTLFTPAQTIASWTTGNFYLSYSTGSAPRYLVSNLKLALSLQNITDRRPPFLRIPVADLPPGQGAVPYDGTNASPVGRLIALQVTKGW